MDAHTSCSDLGNSSVKAFLSNDCVKSTKLTVTLTFAGLTAGVRQREWGWAAGFRAGHETAVGVALLTDRTQQIGDELC